MANQRIVIDMDLGGNAILNCPSIGALRLGERVQKFAQAVAGATTVATFGLAAVASVGTATARAARPDVNGTPIFIEAEKVGLVSALTAGAAAQFRFGGTVYRPTSAGRGGFDVTIRCGCSDAAAVAGARCFYGFAAGVTAAAFANANPSTFFNTLGVGADGGEANLSIISNGSSGTAVKIALGAAFPANTLSLDLYKIRFICDFSSTTIAANVTYEVTNQCTGAFATGILTTSLPTTGIGLEATAWRNNNATLAAVGVDISQVAIIKYL